MQGGYQFCAFSAFSVETGPGGASLAQGAEGGAR